MDITTSKGELTHDDVGYHATGLKKDSLNVYFSDFTGNSKAGESFNTPAGDISNLDLNHFEILSTNALYPLATNTLEHEMAHHFLGHTSLTEQGSRETEADWNVYTQGVLNRPNSNFRQGLEPKSYAAPVAAEAVKPKL